MQRKILIAIDDSAYTKKCFVYVSGLFSKTPEFHCTLLHLQPQVSQYLLDEAGTDPWASMELKRIIKKNTQAAEKLAAEAKAAMIGMGFAGGRVLVQTPMRQLGVSKDILETALKQSYDAIVVGRRGLSRWQQALMGSVSEKLVQHCQATPVWIIDGNPSGRGFLLAVDGSENAMRLVDHVGFMLAGNPAVRLILFHVPQSADDLLETGADVRSAEIDRYVQNSDRSMISEWFVQAKAVLRKAGIGSDRIDIRISRGRGQTARRILETAAKMDCGTVVVGKRGLNRAFFFGSVSHAVAHGLRNRAMWLVP